MFAVVIAMSQEGELLPLQGAYGAYTTKLQHRRGEFFRRHGHWKYRRHERPADRAWGTGGHGDCSTDILIILEYLPSFFKLDFARGPPSMVGLFYAFPFGRPGMTGPWHWKAPVDPLHGRRSDLSQRRSTQSI